MGPTTVPARVRALAVDPRNDSILYLAAPGGGIWRSEDSGEKWVPTMDSAYSQQVCSVALDPNSPDVVYAGTGDDQSPRPDQGVAHSLDGGRSWSMGVRFTDRPVCALAVDPANSARLFGVSSEGLFLSLDSGDRWRNVLPRPVSAVALDGLGNIYVGILGPDLLGSRENLLARSSDGGLTWSNLPLPGHSDAAGTKTHGVSILARGNALYVVVSYQGFAASKLLLDFYRSNDGGSTWTLVAGIGTARQPVTLLADSGAKSLYVIGDSVLLSQNQGDQWTSLRTTTDQFHTGVFTGGSLLLGGEKGLERVPPIPGVRDGVVSSLPIGQFLDVTPDASGNPWAGGLAGLFVMRPLLPTDLSWEPGISGVGIGNVVATTAGSQNIFASGNSVVYHSSNGGASFSSSNVIDSGELRAPLPPLALDPINPAIAFVAGQRLYRTADSGASWTALPMVDSDATRVVIALTIAPSGRAIMYAATACLPEEALASCPSASILWRSQNSGQTWSRMAAVSGLVNRLAVDPRQANTVYAAIGAFPAGPSPFAGYASGDLLRSTDGGLTWISIRANLPRVPMNTIVIDPASSPNLTTPAQTLYVGADAGVFVSFNAGAQWTALQSGLPATPITALSLRQPGSSLLAATFGRGIYQTSVAGLSPGLIVNPLSVSRTLNQDAVTTVGVSLANVSTARLDWRLTPLDSWLSVPQPSGSLEIRGISEAALQVSAAGLQVGTYLGRLRLTTSKSAQNILVTLEVTPSPARLAIVSGNNAIGAVGTALPALTVQVLDAQDASLPGVPVNFAIVSGGGSLSARTIMTNTVGSASTVLTLPNTPGAIQVVATAGNISASFTATASQGVRPVLLSGSVMNGATFNSAAPLAPGSIVSIFGQNLAESSAEAGILPLPTSLLTTRVLLRALAVEVALPLSFVSPFQVNAQLPYDLAAGVYTLAVAVNTVRGNSVEIVIAAAAPGIFTMSSDGRGQGFFVKTDGSLVSVANPASRGSVVSLYATGLGAVNPPVAAGQPGAGSEPLNRIVQTLRVFFDIYEAEVLFSGLAPGSVGLYQVNVRVPTRLSPASNIPASLTVGGAASNRVTIPVQ